MGSRLRADVIGSAWVHVCVDMQRMFHSGTDWAFPWPEQLLSNVAETCRIAGHRNLLTRFLPAKREGDGAGTWSRLYRRWASMTVERIGEEQLQLVSELAEFCGPGALVDKHAYSPWGYPAMHELLHRHSCAAVVISGIETDLCVLATVLGAVDRGYRTILLTDAVASSVSDAQASVLHLLETRLSE